MDVGSVSERIRVDYKGFEIGVESEGQERSYYIMRRSDGWFALEGSGSYTSPTEDMISTLKEILEKELKKPFPFGAYEKSPIAIGNKFEFDMYLEEGENDGELPWDLFTEEALAVFGYMLYGSVKLQCLADAQTGMTYVTGIYDENDIVHKLQDDAQVAI